MAFSFQIEIQLPNAWLHPIFFFFFGGGGGRGGGGGIPTALTKIGFSLINHKPRPLPPPQKKKKKKKTVLVSTVYERSES